MHLYASVPIFGICHLYSKTIEPLGNWGHKIATRAPHVHRLQAATEALGVRWMEAVKVRHAMMANGLVVIMNDGRKFVFSGDTMPCAELVAAGMDAHVLIHEATMGDGMEVHCL